MFKDHLDMLKVLGIAFAFNLLLIAALWLVGLL